MKHATDTGHQTLHTKNVERVLKKRKKQFCLKHLSELSDTYCVSVIRVSDTESKSVETKKKNHFLGHLFDFSDTSPAFSTRIVQVSDTAIHILLEVSLLHRQITSQSLPP